MSDPALPGSDRPPDLRRPALEVAPELLGCVLSTPDAAVRLVEVEAYEGASDPASHAFRGPTRRNGVMFGPAGFLYVYAIHGHACMNVVCGVQGVASAVLLRAGEVIEGLDAVRARRPGVADAWLARGPGNLCRALGIVHGDNGADLRGPRVRLRGAESAPAGLGAAPVILAGPRVNIASASDWPWRFWLAGHPAVSTYKPHPRAATGNGIYPTDGGTMGGPYGGSTTRPADATTVDNEAPPDAHR